VSDSNRSPGDGPVPAGRGVVAGQVAEIIVAVDDAPGRRGSGYRVGPGAVLTAAHVVQDAAAVRVRFDADLPGEWTASVRSCWVDRGSDLAVLSIAPRDGEPPVAVARFGRIGADRAAVVATRAVGFPRFKLKGGDGAGDSPGLYRDSHQADGSAAVLSNRREGTLEVTVSPPERDPDPAVSPWEGMSGAAVWAGDRIVGVIAAHHRSDGLGRLAAARLDLAVASLDPGRRAELRALLGLPEVLPDVVPPSAGDRVRAAYLAQVRDIAPERLLGRGAELDELVGFCAGDLPYAWWQAGPWAGKSALMSWFVLHPPPGVDVVSFFITAGLAGESGRDACTAALIEQLAALGHEPAAPLATAGARRGAMLQLLADAASRSREAGRRLLLVIDGLDEDSGAATGPSIAALLPRQPPPGVRVLVASRPHPPIPDDVLDDDHPLRTLRPRQLDVSGHARSVEQRARYELGQLLKGEPLHREVLGLINAAGGGLTVDDLAELTGRESAQIAGLLGGAFSRSLGSRTGPLSAGYPDKRVYLFAHDTLRVVAEQHYGADLDTYRDRLHQWAATYRQRGWPAGTPHYLLRGYPQLLASVKDLPRLVACATDQARHNRMRGLTGGDALALTEISTAQQLILKQPSPDLTSLALLAVQADDLTGRNAYIPDELPAAWARIGQPDRAEGLASGIPNDRGQRTVALTRLVAAVAASGDHDRAARLADEAETLIRQRTEPSWRVFELAELAETVAATGDDHARAARLADEVARLADGAETLIGRIADPVNRERALARLAGAVAAGGDYGRAEALAGQVTSTQEQAEALVRLTVAASAGGDHDRTARLAGEAESLIGQITDPSVRRWPLAQLVEAVAAAGDHDRAERLAGQIADLADRAAALARIAALAAGDRKRAARLIADAEALAGQVTSPARASAMSLDTMLTAIVSAVAAGGDHVRAAQLADEAAALTGSLAHLAEAVATGGVYERAEALIGQISAPYERMRALARLAHAAAIDDDQSRAARLASEAEAVRYAANPYERRQALAQLAEAASARGDRERAARLIAEAAALIGLITYSSSRERALALLMETTNATGDHGWTTWLAGEAEALIRQDSLFQYSGARKLAELAKAVAAGGHRALAARLIAEAEALVRQREHLDGQPEVLARLAQVAAAVGDRARAARLISEAEALIGQITLPYSRDEALASLAGAVAAGGDHDRAEALTGQITDLNARVAALAGLVTTTAASGDHARAARLAGEAEAGIGQITDPRAGSRAGTLAVRGRALAGLVAAVAASGDHDRAARLAGEAEALARQISHPEYRANAVAELAAVIAAAGDHARAARLVGEAEALARHIPAKSLSPNSAGRSIWLVGALAACGDYDRAEELAGQITDPGSRADAWASLLTAVAEDGDHARAVRLAAEAEALSGQIADLRYGYRGEPQAFQAVLMARLVKAVATSGDHDRAARMAGQAETLIGQITHPFSQVLAVADLADAVAASGNHDRTARLADKAEKVIRQIDFQSRAEPIARLVKVAVANGDHDRAVRLTAEATAFVRQITDPEYRAKPMAQLAGTAAAAGDNTLAARLASEAEALIGQITYSHSRERALAQLVEAVAAVGGHDRAEALAGQMTSPREQARALARLAEAAAAAGDHARAAGLASQAETLIEQMSEPWSRVEVLTGLVGAVAAADQDRAVRLAAETEALIGQTADSESQSVEMARLARTLVTSTKPALIPGGAPSRSPLVLRARRLVAATLVTGSWVDVVVSLARIDPLAATALTNEVLARWELDAPGDQRNETLTMPRQAARMWQKPQWARGFLRWRHGRG